MKKLFTLLIAFVAVLTVAGCKKELTCDEGYHVENEECVMDDTTSPVFTAPDSLTWDIHADFDPLTDVEISAVDDVDGDLTVTVKSNNVDVDSAGSYEVVYEAVDAAGNSSTHTLTVGIDVKAANYLTGIDLGKLTAEEKSVIFAQAERYMLENLYGGVPLWTAADRVMYSSRTSLYTTEYNTVMGYGVAFSDFTATDETVYMDVNNTLGTAGEKTWRGSFSNNPVTLNPWIAEDAVSSDFIGLFTSGLYDFFFDATKKGYEINGALAAGDPVPVGGEEVNGKVYSTTWQITLKDNLEWNFHEDIDTTGWDADYKELDATDFLWTYETALTEGWFRAYSGGGDFISAGVKGADAFYQDPSIGFDKVGFRLGKDSAGNDNPLVLEVEFVTDKSEFDIKYMFAGSQTPVNEEIFDAVGGTSGYGLDPLTVAASGIYIMDEWTNDQLITYVKNDTYNLKDMYHFDGQQYTFIADENSIFAEFLAGRLDTAAVPSDQIEDYLDDDRVYAAPDAATWRINFNAFGTTEVRDAYIAKYPELGLDETYVPEPIIQYLEFRQAVYYGVDRQEAAVNVVGTFLPATTYMSAQYFLDAESGLSIRGTEVGLAVETDFAGDSYGYFPSAATDLWKQAVTKALADGFYSDYDAATATEANPYEIEFLFTYHTPTHLDRAKFVGYITTELEKLLVDDERHIVAKLNVTPVAYPNHYDEYLQTASTDMGIGAISGSLLDAPSFLDVFNDDNAGGFTLNWGIDTHSANIPISYTYDGEYVTELWSYNAIAKALNGKAYIKDGNVQEYWDSESALIDAALDMKGTSLSSTSDGTALVEPILGDTLAELATFYSADSMGATVVVAEDGSETLYLIAETDGQYELKEELGLFTDVVAAITAHAGYAPDGFAASATLLATDADVVANAYAAGHDPAWTTLAELYTAAGADPTYAQAYDVHWDFNAMGYGEWDDIYVVLKIGDYFVAWYWL